MQPNRLPPLPNLQHLRSPGTPPGQSVPFSPNPPYEPGQAPAPAPAQEPQGLPPPFPSAPLAPLQPSQQPFGLTTPVPSPVLQTISPPQQDPENMIPSSPVSDPILAAILLRAPRMRAAELAPQGDEQVQVQADDGDDDEEDEEDEGEEHDED
ncbi:hypothetical protein K488DRAFT_91251 [Vararia minispora EC-137]|uniref:Uncharacterized protein n=1 Tax=Vararia minispora EC-137 TaxID=1314806 RepID=A0ACB8Q682_9AGAM|nr:hypothetical protein K488DRAFT_91251 [Vararia minispora EC-137]